MNYKIITYTICFMLVVLMGMGVTSAQNNFLIKDYILARADVQEYIPKGDIYIETLDSFVEARIDTPQDLRDIASRIDGILPELGQSQTHKRLRLIIVYLKQKILKELQDIRDDISQDAADISGSVKLDLNHPLVGQTLRFEVELIALRKASGNTQALSAEIWDSVSVHYDGYLVDGTLFDSSHNRGQTLDFELGAGQMIEGFNDGFIGMRVGEKKTLVLPPEIAYGYRDEEAFEIVPKSELQQFVDAGFKLEVGVRLPTQFGELEILEVYD
ncbi:FKBP-type peptidyl-prolyl cis-trans isomerase [Candidatus Gracilibacteria bacterium]|nr:FKBP-type peptidyl-prolyl cis-trans isomerase [Candidatus Gracilibacteria bacterium]